MHRPRCLWVIGIASLLLSAPFLLSISTPALGQPFYSEMSCSQLWLARNSVFARDGYCFTSVQARAIFGKGCFPPFGELDSADQREVQVIKQWEGMHGCDAKDLVIKAPGSPVPILIGGDPDFEACARYGQVVGLNPAGDGFLAVRNGPAAREVDRLYNGQEVYICDDVGTWYAIVYAASNQDLGTCNVNKPWHYRMPYTGPCRYGWVSSQYIKVVAG